MATWIIGILLVAALFFAGRYVFRKTKNGECAGCSGGCHGGCCHGQEPGVSRKK